MPNPLTTTSILLDLEIRKWAGEVADKKALQAVADKFNSDTHNDKYKKSLFVTSPLAVVDRNAGRVRNHFYSCTVPWLDGGKGRLIPSMNFQEFASKHSKLKHEFYQSVEEFIQEYPDHQDLARQKKGDLYQENEYPSIDQLRRRFEISLSTLPFPNIDDYRVDAPQAVIDELQTSMRESVERVQLTVSRELRDRFNTRLQMLRKTLMVGQRFATSLLTELDNVISMGKNLHETITPLLYTEMLHVEKHILKYDAEMLRNSESAQADVIGICNAILQR